VGFFVEGDEVMVAQIGWGRVEAPLFGVVKRDLGGGGSRQVCRFGGY